MSSKAITIPKLQWQDSLKAFALLGILLNHLVEEFHKGPLFSGFQDFSLIRLLAWVGDFGPGVFIICSGIGLTWAALHRNQDGFSPGEFYKRRLIRIFPLYVGLHLFLLAVAVVAPESILREHHAYPLTLAHPKMLLSIVGLRITDTLFFFISPSWWFVWLVIQLYLVFPALFLVMRRIDIKLFLLFTLTLTLVCRAFGILFPEAIPWQLNRWLFGIFFGTRLFEFCSGMGIAYYLKQRFDAKRRLPSTKTIFLVCFPILIIGLTSQVYHLGKIISFPMISFGLTGIFYVFWQSVFSKIPTLGYIITWIGVESYSIFLIHQPPLQYSKLFARHSEYLHLLVAICVLLLSFPAGWLSSRVVAKIHAMLVFLKGTQTSRLISIIVIASMGLLLIFIDMPTDWGWKHRIFSLSLGLSIMLLAYFAYDQRTKETWVEHVLKVTILVAAILKISIFHSRYGTFAALGIGFSAACLVEMFDRRFHSRCKAWALTLTGLITVIFAGETAIRLVSPIGYGYWGELPALQEHPTRTYSLKPDIEKRLRYYTYDYLIRTNSFGLASPEIETDRPTPNTLRILIVGDAFSMPEGLEYNNAYPALLEKSMAHTLAPRNIQVINAGVTGYGPVEQTPQLRELGQLFKPDIVIYQYFINEIGSVNRNPKKLLVNIGLTPCFISGYCNYAHRSELMHRIGKIGSYFVNKLTDDRRQAKRNYAKAFMEYYRKENLSLYSDENLEKLQQYIEEMNEICSDLDAKFVVYFVPAAIAVSKPSDLKYFPQDLNSENQNGYDFSRPFRATKSIMDKLGIAIVDLSTDFKNHPNQPNYFPEQIHWNKEGHKVAAQAIKKDLIQRGWAD